MKGHFHFCDKCGKREWSTLPKWVGGNYSSPIGWISLSERLESTHTVMDFCSMECVIASLSEEQA